MAAVRRGLWDLKSKISSLVDVGSHESATAAEQVSELVTAMEKVLIAFRRHQREAMLAAEHAQHIDALQARLARQSDTLKQQQAGQEQERKAYHAELSQLQSELAAIESRLAHTVGIDSRSKETQQRNTELTRRFMRAESFRKALVFQKKYLLMLLGEFHESEEATLAFISRLADPVPGADPMLWRRQKRGIPRFRKAVWAIIALKRVRSLAARWNRTAYEWKYGSQATVRGAAPAESYSARLERLIRANPK